MLEQAADSQRLLRVESAKVGQSRHKLLLKYIFLVLPQVKNLLRQWQRLALHCPEPELKLQALASLKQKAFHCQGGAVFAVEEQQVSQTLLRLIVAYQTLCDYLDNLCDRAGQTDGQAFRQLHLSLIDALDPAREMSDYYRYYNLHNDGGYVTSLVIECRKQVALLPSYHLVKDDIINLAAWYCELQVRKHLPWEIREEQLREWLAVLSGRFPGLLWNELAAATGSTLAVFALLKLASQSQLNPALVQQTLQAYFPWICALHILLDYFIDQQEDREGGDLNFTFYYRDDLEMMNRLKICVNEAGARSYRLPSSVLDRTVVEGLLAMYLSDRKVVKQGLLAKRSALIMECGGSSAQVLALCRWVRKLLL